MQYFTGDALELKIEGAFGAVFAQLGRELSAWLENACSSAGLGEVLYDGQAIPLCGTLARDVFINNYSEILRRWEYAGSFESYLFVFKQIFGHDTQIEFERLPRPGGLVINIQAQQDNLYKWLAKEAGAYVSTHEGQNIVLHSLQTIGDFYEVQSVLESLNPAGIYLRVNFKLIVGEN